MYLLYQKTYWLLETNKIERKIYFLGIAMFTVTLIFNIFLISPENHTVEQLAYFGMQC